MNSWFKQYYNKCIQILDEMRSKIEKKVSRLKEDIAFYLERSTKATLRLREQQKMEMLFEQLKVEKAALEKLKKYRKELDTNVFIKEQFLKLKSHHKIEKVLFRFDNKIIDIYTEELKVSGSRIGKFRISIELNNSTPFKIKNLTYKVNDKFDHWFVKNEKPCFGSWQPVVDKYLQTGHVFLCIDTLIHFLLSIKGEHGFLKSKDWLKSFTEQKHYKSNTNSGYLTVDMETTVNAGDSYYLNHIMSRTRVGPSIYASVPEIATSPRNVYMAVSPGFINESPSTTNMPITTWLYDNNAAS